eukprot:TRINITY_DN17638_c0_g1_i1.p1 TRINITY_DN17638_c0_g1~~TRINITY_DN17638_c0_g1_i1.p1  ORF type:complete len:258 (-),score=56.78 TRINITY_DN17638_c0_g1_i1:39-812(-)
MSKIVLILLIVLFAFEISANTVEVQSWFYGDKVDHKPLTFQEVMELEQKPGTLSHLPQVNASAPPKHPNIDGIPGESPAIGPNDAHVRLYVFSDFQCPNCMRAAEPLKYLVKEMNGKLQVVFKHYPLPSHKRAEPAARASLAAARQGLFWEYHDELWLNMRYLTDGHLKQYAEKVGCNVEQWETDFNSEAIAQQVKYETNLGEKIGVHGTPAFMIGNRLESGWGSISFIQQDVNRALSKGHIEKNEFCNFEGYPCNA